MWKRLRQWLAPSTASQPSKPRAEPRADANDLPASDDIPVDLSRAHALAPQRFDPVTPADPWAEPEPQAFSPARDSVSPESSVPPLAAPLPGNSLDASEEVPPADSGVLTAQAAPSTDAQQPDMLVHVFATRRDAAQPSFPLVSAEHATIDKPHDSEPLQHLMHYVQGSNPAELGPLRMQLHRHLQRVHHMWRLEVPSAQLEAMGLWATQINAVLALPDGSVRDPKGYVLLPAPGDREDELARIPYTPEAWQRKRRSEQLMLERSLSPDVSLSPIASEDEVDLRSAEEAAGRMLALLLVAARADLLSSPNAQELNPQALQDKLPQALPHLSPQEQAFMAQHDPDPSAVQAMTWRYEAMFTLMWALALIDELPWPDQVCNIGHSVSQLLQSNIDELLQNALLRPSKELLDQLDLHQRMHALAREAELNNRPLPQLNRSVIMERHRALNWLISHEHASWDKVNTPS